MYNPYAANHKGWDHVGNLTPNVEISEGIRPAEELKPAGYLKLVRFDKFSEDYYVVSAGKVVALDSNGDVVPAGLALQAAQYKTTWDATNGNLGANRTAARAAVVNTSNLPGVTVGAAVYDAADVSPIASAVAVKTATGNAVALGQQIVENFFTVVTDGGTKRVCDLITEDEDDSDSNLTQVLFVSKPIGIAPYNYFRGAGGDGFNPSEYTHHNYNRQHQVAVLCDYYIELPIVADKTFIKFPQLSCLHDPNDVLLPGDFLVVDASSDMVEWAGSESFSDVIGQVWKIDTGYPKDYLDRVRTAYSGMGALDKMPGTANAGLPDQISYSGGDGTLGMCRINLINR
jgi:hypothetical protein